MDKKTYEYLKQQLKILPLTYNNGWGTFSGCCGSNFLQEAVPRGINLSIDTEPFVLPKVPGDDSRYRWGVNNVKIKEDVWVNITTRHVEDVYCPNRPPHGAIATPKVPVDVSNNFLGAYWEAVGYVFMGGFCCFDFKRGNVKIDIDEFFEEFKKEYAGKYLYWILLPALENHKYFMEKAVKAGHLKIIHQTELFNNYNYDKPEDYLIGYLTQV